MTNEPISSHVPHLNERCREALLNAALETIHCDDLDAPVGQAMKEYFLRYIDFQISLLDHEVDRQTLRQIRNRLQEGVDIL